MKTIDKQKLISRGLFKKMTASVNMLNAQTKSTLDDVAQQVIENYEKKNDEIQKLTEQERGKLSVYLQSAYME